MLTKLRFHRLSPDLVTGGCSAPTCRDIRGDAAFRHYHFRNRITRVWAKGSKHPSKHSLRPDQLSRVFPQCGIVILAQQCVVVRHSQEDFVSAVHDRSPRICILTRCDILSTGCALCLTYPLAIPRKWVRFVSTQVRLTHCISNTYDPVIPQSFLFLF